MNYLNKKEIMQLAMTYMKQDTYDPYMAVYLAMETWLKKKLRDSPEAS